MFSAAEVQKKVGAVIPSLTFDYALVDPGWRQFYALLKVVAEVLFGYQKKRLTSNDVSKHIHRCSCTDIETPKQI